MVKKVKNFEEDFNINWKIPEGLEMTYISCGINSLLCIIENLKCQKKISSEQIKNIFEFDSDGIHNNSYMFNRLNKLIKDSGGYCKLNIESFNSVKDITKQFKLLPLPIPIYFDIDILNEINTKLEECTGYKYNLEDSHLSYSLHLLLFIGYSSDFEKLYFIDPNFMLPNYQQKDLKNKDKLIVLSNSKFYQYKKRVSQYMRVKCTKQEKKLVKKGGLDEFIKE